MPASDDHPSIKNRGTVYRPGGEGLRYMRRRRVGSADRNGDPLDGLVNLFYVGVILAVGLLVAALSAAGLSGLLTSRNMTIVTNPGTPQMQVVVKQGDKIVKLDLAGTPQVQGLGTLMGSFYKLADGTVVYVAAGSLPPAASTPVPSASSSPEATTTPEPTTTDYPTTDPYASPEALPSEPPTPDASATLAP
jgi:hypothetical protein